MPKNKNEQIVQFTVSPSLKKAIRRKALESDETIRTFILRAIRNSGIPISDAELADRRKATSK